MTTAEAMKILKESLQYSTAEKPAAELNKAIGCFAELNGWTKQNAAVQMVELCLLGAEKYKRTNACTLRKANAASNVALYLGRQAAKDILSQRKEKKEKEERKG